MNKVYIVWGSSGSYEDYRTYIHKIYSSEESANIECNRLNTELTNNRNKLEEILKMHPYYSCMEDECKICEEYNTIDNSTYEQWEYTVQCKDVEV